MRSNRGFPAFPRPAAWWSSLLPAPASRARRPSFVRRVIVPLSTALALVACGPAANAPYPEAWIRGKVFFTSFQERPKYLDPVSSYSNNETPWMQAVYEPPLQYHYLKRPYVLEGRSSAGLPEVRYLDAAGARLPDDAPADKVAQSVYTIRILPGIRYQPHPALARDAQGRLVYHALSREDIARRDSIPDFPLEDVADSGVLTSTREAVAEDFVYEVKRLASPWVHTPSPIYGVMSESIVGLREFGDRLRARKKLEDAGRAPAVRWHDLRAEPLEGASAPDPHTFVLRVKGRAPQMAYWLTLTFFAPLPWEAEAFYEQPGMAEHGFSLNLWPVGTGPFLLAEQGATRYVLERNPNFHGIAYPTEGMPGDAEAGLLDAAGKRMPFLDRVVSTVEKEREPSLAKFLQGYYDAPFIERPDPVNVLQKELQDGSGRAAVLRAHGVRIASRRDPNNWYVGFNWLDPVVGRGATPAQQARNRKLRQAISIATDWEEFAAIFFDIYGDSEVAMSPLPPGLSGRRTGREGVNPVTHAWVDGQARRRPIEDARRLLAEAGYPGGLDARTGQPLVLTYDTSGATPAFQARLDWMVKQYAKLGIQLEVRAADYNRYQERLIKGAHQTFFNSWIADYPDPENYLFLFYGPQGRTASGGDNDSNYSNPEYDRLYREMRVLPDGPARQAVIDRMVDILREDAVWMFGIFPGVASGYQPWVKNGIASIVVRDELKYLDVDPEMRVRKLREWNQPHWWPLGLVAGLLALLSVPAVLAWRRRENRDARTALVWTAGPSRRDRGAGGEDAR